MCNLPWLDLKSLKSIWKEISWVGEILVSLEGIRRGALDDREPRFDQSVIQYQLSRLLERAEELV